MYFEVVGKTFSIGDRDRFFLAGRSGYMYNQIRESDGQRSLRGETMMLLPLSTHHSNPGQ